ncbi:hypothetical protein QYF61_016423 [Mycteria americana]|uniref:Uncharacterized protein n=1 Tax=Mycteria americana TaxID=33587 RepID=A0AAN7NKY0_MYCAM|nr:hypothetical protein QYF61_016423 [Mycteria americana]
MFLTVPDTRAPWSLTQRAAYWAGGLDPSEWGDPVTIPTLGLDQITECVQKASCLQLMHDRRLIPHQPSPMLLKADPSRMKPLIKGLPDPLKLYAIQIQDCLSAAFPIQEHLTEMLTPGRNQTRPAPAEFPLTWGGVAQELISYSCNVGISRGEQRGKAAGENQTVTDLIRGAPDLNEYHQCCTSVFVQQLRVQDSLQKGTAFGRFRISCVQLTEEHKYQWCIFVLEHHRVRLTETHTTKQDNANLWKSMEESQLNEIYRLQAEQPQLSQPVLIGEVFHPSDHFRGLPLDPLQQLHVLFVLRTPELDAVLQSRVVGRVTTMTQRNRLASNFINWRIPQTDKLNDLTSLTNEQRRFGNGAIFRASRSQTCIYILEKQRKREEKQEKERRREEEKRKKKYHQPWIPQ